VVNKSEIIKACWSDCHR